MLLQLLYTELGSLYVMTRSYASSVEFVIICRVVGLNLSWRSTVREISIKMDEFSGRYSLISSHVEFKDLSKACQSVGNINRRLLIASRCSSCDSSSFGVGMIDFGHGPNFLASCPPALVSLMESTKISQSTAVTTHRIPLHRYTDEDLC